MSETTLLQVGSKFKTSAVGITVTSKPKYAEWEIALSTACGIAKSCPWWIGDLLNLGEHSYGETYSQALSDTGLDEGYLRNLKWVCSRVELSDRSDKLSFSHHTLVAPLDQDEQKKWLVLAVNNKWSVAELRAAMREGQEEDEGDVDEEADGLVSVLATVQEFLDSLDDDTQRLTAVHGIERKLKSLEKKYGGSR